MVDIQSLHGQYFTATICFDEVVGRISVKDEDTIYLCQDVMDGSESCRDFFGYKYAWYMTIGADPKRYEVFNLKILPPPTEYHALFQEIIEKRGPTWDEDGSYSVIPNEVLAKIRAFLDGIKVFEQKKSRQMKKLISTYKLRRPDPSRFMLEVGTTAEVVESEFGREVVLAKPNGFSQPFSIPETHLIDFPDFWELIEPKNLGK